MLQDEPDFTVRVKKIAEHPCPCRTGLDTGRKPPVSASLYAECTLLHLSSFAHPVTEIMLFFRNFIQGNKGIVPIEPSSIIGTGGDAIPATNTPIVVYNDQPVRLHPGGLCGASFNTRGILAVKTLNPHIKVVCNRHFMKEFAVTGFWRHLETIAVHYIGSES